MSWATGVDVARRYKDVRVGSCVTGRGRATASGENATKATARAEVKEVASMVGDGRVRVAPNGVFVLEDNAVEQALGRMVSWPAGGQEILERRSEDEIGEREERRSPWLGWSVGEQEEQREPERLQAILRGRWGTSARFSREQFGKVAHAFFAGECTSRPLSLSN